MAGPLAIRAVSAYPPPCRMSQPSSIPTVSDDAAAAVPRRWLPPLRAFGVAWPVLALGLLLAFDGCFTTGFFHVGTRDGRLFGTPVDVLHRASPVVLLAVGMTGVIATGGVDLSVGATMAIAGTVAAVWVRGPVDAGNLPTTAGGHVVVALALAVAAAAACGAWNGVLVAGFGIQPIVATLILMEAGRGVAELLSGGQTVTLAGDPLRWLYHVPPGRGLYQRLIYPLPLDVPEAIAVAAGVGWLARRTAVGLFLEAVGGNPLASRYAGVDARAVTFAAYVACGVTAGLAGLVETADLSAAPIGLGLTRELDAILAVCLGGTALAGGRFSLAGSVVGAVIIPTLFETIQLTHFRGRQIPDQWFLVAKAAVIVVVCVLSGVPKRRA